jgi:uncharacterized protein YbjQ (UPF0145 family)
MDCKECGNKLPFFAKTNTCEDCMRQIHAEGDQEQKAQQEQERQSQKQAKSVVVTTTPSLEGWVVTEYLGIESVEFVIGTGPISELVSEVQDLFGARSSPFEKKLQAAKQTAFETLKYRAALKGGNAVVGVDLDYIEFSGNRIGLIVNGTVVSVAQED